MDEKKKNRIKKKKGSAPLAARTRRRKNSGAANVISKRKKAAAKGNERTAYAGKGELVECIYSGSGSAFGFAKPVSDDYAGDDLFIPPAMTAGAMNGDKILVRKILPGEYGFGKGNEGAVEEILERKCVYITGVFRIIGDIPYVIPDDKKVGQAIEILYSSCDVNEGDKVKIKITVYPDEYKNLPYVKRRRHSSYSEMIEPCAGGEVETSYGPAQTKGANYEAILDMAGIPRYFPEEVITEANNAADTPLVIDGRIDLRDQIIFTIDGAGAKDLDDAISVSREKDGYILGVHIADVSHYVRKGGEVDREALSRGTSVYFVDKVVPMLPEVLSNGCCSLNAGEDKYALSAIITLDKTGEIVSAKFAKTVIRSVVRGVYTEVNDIFDKGEKSPFAEKYAKVLPSLEVMEELYRILDRRGRERGALELEGDEAVILLDGEGMPQEIVSRSRGIAERLIEQFMLRANVAAATFLKDSGRSGVYRIHEEPSAEKMQSFGIFAHNMGLDVSGICKIHGDTAEVCKNITPLMLSELLGQAKEKGIGEIVSGVMLRSLMKAKYSPAPSLHFGLAEELYCHFTSPIRRYPDLFVHRAISAAISGSSDIKGSAEAAERSTETEIRAVDAERQIEALYIALYMSNHIGESFDAVITSVTSFGIFARTENMCEGLIPASEIGENVLFNDKLLTLTARVGEAVRVFRLGDKVRVTVTASDITTGKVTYGLMD